MGGLEEKSIKVFNLPDSRYIHRPTFYSVIQDRRRQLAWCC